MEVIDECSALLSNYEVYKVLKETREDQKKIKNNFAKANLRNLSTIAYETLKYFDTISPCRLSGDDVIPEFLEETRQFNLSKTELLQLVNLKPRTHVELHAVIEECEERYTENQIAMLLEVISRHLHVHARARASDSVSSFLSAGDETEVQMCTTTTMGPNSPISHEVELDSSYSDKGKRKLKKGTHFSEGTQDELEDDDVITKTKRTTSNILVSDEEEDEGDEPDSTKTNKKSKVKIKVNKLSKKFKKSESPLKQKKKRNSKPKRVSISLEVENIF